MKKFKTLPAVLAALALLLAAAVMGFMGFGGNAAYAATTGTYLSGYDVTYIIASDRSIAVTEDITVNFAGNTGFIRDIPVNGGEIVKNVEVSEITGGSEKSVAYFVYTEDSDFISVDIGDQTKKQGERTYRIRYDYCLTKAQEGSDMLALTPIGAGWSCDIENITIKMVLPEGYNGSSKCFINAGAAQSVVPVERTTEKGRTVLSASVASISANSEVRFDIGFEGGALSTYFDFTPLLFSLVALALLVVVIVVRLLCFNKHALTPVVNFEAPKKMDPLLMGKLIDNKVNNEDITSMIFYWADKGYLKINLDDKDDPTMIRLVRDLPSTCQDYEQLMFSQLFNGRDAVKPSELRNHFYTTVETVTAKVNARAKGLYDSKSIGVSVIFAILGGLLLSGAPFLLGFFRIHSSFHFYYSFLALVPAIVVYGVTETAMYYNLKLNKKKKALFVAAIVALCAVFTALYVLLVPSYIIGWLPKLLLCVICFSEIVASVFIVSRTKEYTQSLNDIVGFRNFILLAEKDRLEALLEEDPQFYYHILPYAQVLGVSDRWEEKFKDITVQPPQWMTSSVADNMISFYFVNSAIRSSMGRMGANMVSRPSSSGSSGGGHSSFGGFSGGGHGGGGGRFR